MFIVAFVIKLMKIILMLRLNNYFDVEFQIMQFIMICQYFSYLNAIIKTSYFNKR